MLCPHCVSSPGARTEALACSALCPESPQPLQAQAGEVRPGGDGAGGSLVPLGSYPRSVRPEGQSPSLGHPGKDESSINKLPMWP